MNTPKNILGGKAFLIFVALLFLFFCAFSTNILSQPFFSTVAEAIAVAEAQETEEADAELQEEEEFLEDEDEEDEEDEEEEEEVEIPMGFEEFPEFKSNPDNPNRDMIKREDYNDLPVSKFPYFGLTNREAVWVVAQLHILFASFILGVPLFTIISEILYWKTGDERYERLAYEITKVVTMCYSLTALTGGFLVLLLIVFYPTFTTWMFRGFNNLITFWYPMVFLAETILLYLYYYLWEPLNKANRKGLHIFIGLLLNVAGISLLFIMNAPVSFMQTPPKIDGSIIGIATFGEWAWVNNFTWMPLNYHRLVGNLTFGGYLVGMIAAFMYIFSKDEKERAYYDWQGYLGNTLGIGFLLPLPFMGYYLSRELYMYDAAIGMYIMSDRLSMFMLVQAVLIGFLFVGSSYYIWISMQRIEGAEKYLKWVKRNFWIMFVCAAIWFAPRHFFATMILEPGMVPEGMEKDAFLKLTELPGPLAFYALMKAKNAAVFVLIIITLVNYVLYRVAIKKGRIVWGKINPVSQYILIFLAFSVIWLMGLMGAIRSLARKNFHVYRVFKDMTPDAYTPTLKDSAILVTEITLAFFAILGIVIWLQLKVGKSNDH